MEYCVEYQRLQTRGLNQEYSWTITFIINQCNAILESEPDDVYGEDPTVNELERLSAEMFGKEAAVLVTSGTMGNLVSVLAHCQRGDQIVVGDKCHIYRAEDDKNAHTCLRPCHQSVSDIFSSEFIYRSGLFHSRVPKQTQSSERFRDYIICFERFRALQSVLG